MTLSISPNQNTHLLTSTSVGIEEISSSQSNSFMILRSGLRKISEEYDVLLSLTNEQLIERMNFDNGMSDRDVECAWISSDSEDDLKEKKPRLRKRKIKVRRSSLLRAKKNLFNKTHSQERLKFEGKDDFKEIEKQNKVHSND